MLTKSVNYPVEGIEAVVKIDFDAMPLLMDAESADFDFIEDD